DPRLRLECESGANSGTRAGQTPGPVATCVLGDSPTQGRLSPTARRRKITGPRLAAQSDPPRNQTRTNTAPLGALTQASSMFPRPGSQEKLKVLLLENIHQSANELLTEQGFNVERVSSALP